MIVSENKNFIGSLWNGLESNDLQIPDLPIQLRRPTIQLLVDLEKVVAGSPVSEQAQNIDNGLKAIAKLGGLAAPSPGTPPEMIAAIRMVRGEIVGAARRTGFDLDDYLALAKPYQIPQQKSPLITPDFVYALEARMGSYEVATRIQAFSRLYSPANKLRQRLLSTQQTLAGLPYNLPEVPAEVAREIGKLVVTMRKTATYFGYRGTSERQHALNVIGRVFLTAAEEAGFDLSRPPEMPRAIAGKRLNVEQDRLIS